MKNIEDCIRNPDWWRAAGLRCLRTFAQALLAAIPAVVIGGEGWGWIYSIPAALGTATLAALISILMSLSGLPEVKEK